MGAFPTKGIVCEMFGCEKERKRNVGSDNVKLLVVAGEQSICLRERKC